MPPNAQEWQSAPPPAPPAAPATPPRAWDRPLTYALLALGFFGMLIGAYGGTSLGPLVEQAAELQGMTLALPAWTDAAGMVLVISHPALYALGFGIAITRLRQGRLAFWAPLAAGLLAALIYNGVITAIAIAGGATFA